MTDSYESIKTELDGLKKRLDEYSEEYFIKVARKSANQENVFDSIKEIINNQNQAFNKIYLEADFSSEDKWEKLSADKKQEIIDQVRKKLPDSLKVVSKSLRRIDNAQQEARAVIIVGIILLVALIIVYLRMHDTKKRVFYNNKAETVFFSNLGQIKKELSEPHVEMKNVNRQLQHFFESKVENDKLFLFIAFSKKIAFLKGITSDSNNKQDSVDVKKSKILENNQADPRIVLLTSEIDKMAKEADAFSKDGGYFWIIGCWRWLEVIFWGEFGVLVGILAWVSRKVENGEFTKERFDNEVLWYLTEVFIGPIVIVAAFFLLNQFIGTMMSGVSAEDVRMSIYITLGLSFTLGLFLRRTLGIFDSIKNKLPLPGGEPVK
ncbi:MAG: hypothetical protein GY707_04980 [Desulfobacteraceae bacterium]|nr:hypothetical protein [Desulfobacteraceae bacterium]